MRNRKKRCRNKIRRDLRRWCCVICSMALLALGIPISARAAEITLTLEQAQTLALTGSNEYKKIKSSLNLQLIKYADSVKSIWLKQKDMMTFRWTPLLSFKFPERPDLADSYEWQYKPIQIQTEITALNHELNDIKYTVLEETAVLYTEAYVLQEKLDFTQERLEKLEDTIVRNEWRLKTGEAVQSEVEKLYSFREKLMEDFSLLNRQAEAKRKKLAERIGMGAEGLGGLEGYHLDSPLLSGETDRSVLEELKEYTLKNDQKYYETQLDTKLGLLSLETNEKLMKSQYGSKMQTIQVFINQAKQGQELEEDVFKAAYDQFLENIDKPWNGAIRILFIKIPKEWFKGSLDGVRYIEDDPYILYTDALEYAKLLTEEESVKRELCAQVTDSFETLVSAENAWRSLERAVSEEQEQLEKDTARNRLGTLTLDELQAEQESLEELRLQALDALSEYSCLSYSFDRLTCGGYSRYLNGETLELPAASGGESYLEETGENPAYYIRSIVEEQMFELGILIPDDFTPEITGFELWVNGVQVGERTPADEPLRHLTLALDGIDTALVKLYRGEEPVCECGIETMAESGELVIQRE